MAMHRVARTLLPAVLVLGFMVRLAGAPRQQAKPEQQAAFRSGVTAVPLDVRVVDRDGRPVTDLKEEDFVIYEDDVPQTIVHFAQQVLAPGTPGPPVRARAELPEAVVPPQPQTRRIFLIVMGPGAIGTENLVSVSPSGSVHGPRTLWPHATKVIDGLVHFARERLLPQDQVALLAYNRATDFTVDHEAIAGLLERLRESVAGGRAAMARQPVAAPGSQAADDAARRAVAEELGFAEYVQARSSGIGELSTIRYGLKYLRYMDGEKHLIWVTANGLVEPMDGSLEAAATRDQFVDPKQLAAEASDARVTVHTIHTGGLGESPGSFVAPLPIMQPILQGPGARWGTGSSGASSGSPVERSVAAAEPRATVRTPGWDTPGPPSPIAMPGLTAASMGALADLRLVASLTGGTSSAMTVVANAVDRVDAQTRASYLLVYYPTNASYDGRYRNIRVEVKRPGATVLFRHGYYGRAQPRALNRRRVVTEGWFAAAAASRREFRGIRLTLSPTFWKDASDGGGQVVVSLLIDGTKLTWTTDELSRRVAHLDVGIYCADARQNVVGLVTRTLDITLTEQRFAQLSSRRLPYATEITVVATPRFVKAIVYDYESNLIGSTVARVK